MHYHVKVYRAAEGIRQLKLTAPDQATAITQAEQEGYRVIAVSRPWNLPWRPAAQRFSVPMFSQEVLALLDAGLGLVETVGILGQKSRQGETRRVLQSIHRHLHEGLGFSAALERLPDVFSPLYVATVRTSERTGNLAVSLQRYLSYHAQVNQVRDKVAAASVYPAVLSVVGVAVIMFLLGYVVPRFSKIYEDLGGDLPWTSRLLMHWGQLVESHGLSLLSALAAFVVIAAVAVADPALRAFVARRCWSLPGVGEKIRLYELARFTRTMAMLLSGGVPVPAALRVVGDLLSQPGLKQSLVAATRSIDEGRMVSEAFGQHGLATDIGVRLLQVGERSGELSTAMERIAKLYEDDVARSIDWFTRLFEPLLMVTIGSVIGVLVVLMYLPIFELANNLQ